MTIDTYEIDDLYERYYGRLDPREQAQLFDSPSAVCDYLQDVQSRYYASDDDDLLDYADRIWDYLQQNRFSVID